MRRVGIVMVGVVLVAFAGGLTPLGRDLAFHAVPLRWTGEAERLAQVLDVREGSTVAEIGAGSGAMIVALAEEVGPNGRAFATERTTEQRHAIARRAASAGVTVSVLEAPDLTTNLPDGCCDAIVMRLVLHHISDLRAYAASLRRALKPQGRWAIIDFAPGALPHLEHDHGVAANVAVAALRDAGFVLESHDDRWGGRTYLLVLR
jgi:ubiquinone/menaquinone biosynthesis C-methylase UbiE